MVLCHYMDPYNFFCLFCLLVYILFMYVCMCALTLKKSAFARFVYFLPLSLLHCLKRSTNLCNNFSRSGMIYYRLSEACITLPNSNKQNVTLINRNEKPRKKHAAAQGIHVFKTVHSEQSKSPETINVKHLLFVS